MTADTPHEIEAKYTLGDDALIEALAGLRVLGPYRLEPAETQDQQNTYFDTADGRVAAQHAGLRVRVVGERRIASVKTAGMVRDGLHERGEWEVEIAPRAGSAIGASDAPEAWPASEARERALALTGGELLLPIVHVRTLRRILHAFRDDALVAELALDDGTISAGTREQSFRELEIELRPGGTRDDLAALAELLGEHAALLPENRSKLARGLALLGGSPDTPPALAAIAVALFERTAKAHRLPPALAGLVITAAAAYEAALRHDAEKPWAAARDWLLLDPPGEGAAEAMLMAAGAAALLREQPRPRREPALVALRPRRRKQALRLGALLRVAVALGRADTPCGVTIAAGATRIVVPDDAVAEQVEASAEFWRRRIGALVVSVGVPEPDVVLKPASAPSPLALFDSASARRSKLHGGDTAAEGVRWVLRRFFEKMLAREAAVRTSDDTEDVHQMRVATRRLRASLAVMEGVYDDLLVRHFRRGLREVAAALGPVRDSDVFIDAVLAYGGTLSETERPSLNTLLIAVRAERAEAREQLRAALASNRHRRFMRRFAVFVSTQGAGVAAVPASGSPRVRDIAGGVIWRRFEELRAFEPALYSSGMPAREELGNASRAAFGAPDATLHEARIAGKRLRYTLELFAEALGPGVDDALTRLGVLQEALGGLQDAVVARERVARLGLEDDPGARAYLAALEDARVNGLETLPEIWAHATGDAAAHALLDLIAAL